MLSDRQKPIRLLHRKKKYPSKMKLVKLEKHIQAEIMDFLWSKKLLAFHIPNHGLYNPVTKNYRAVGRHHIPGIPDICVVLRDSRCLWIEVKAGKNKPSVDQLAFHAKLKELGHPVIVAYDVKEVATFLAFSGVA